jgi:hypothetical protein
VKTDNGIIHYSSKADYLSRKPALVKEAAKKMVNEGLLEKGATTAKGIVGDEVSISQAAKEQAAGVKNLNSKGLGEEAKTSLKEIPNKIKDKVIEGKSAGQHLLAQAGSAVMNAVTGGALPGISLPSISIGKGAGEVREAPKVKTEENPLINKPGIFFVRGFSLNPFEGDDKGLGAMSANIPTSQVFKWNDEDAIIEQVLKRPPTQPIILVGHGMGGDTAVSVSNKLNSIDHGFRKVDLLVTLDSVGTDNDIIPQNVKENFNLISDRDYLFNDGPNIARKKGMTKVTNELLEANHNELETLPEIQFLVYEKVNQTLMNAIKEKDFKAALNQKLLDSHRLSSLASNPSLQNPV